MWCIGAHGGVRRYEPERAERLRSTLLSILEAGGEMLRRGASALDAVEYTVNSLEDSGLFNAGVGSVLNFIGKIEMDAGIMVSYPMRAGAVAGISNVRNPISVARKVMELTDHVLLAGEWANRFAAAVLSDKVVELEPDPDKLKEYYDSRKRFEAGISLYKKNPEFFRDRRELFEVMETVGAVALDENGVLAAGASTGGLWLKFPGRIGDSAIPGAGFYADSSAAASATGIGEYIMIANLCVRAVDLVTSGYSVERAAEASINMVSRIAGEGTAGIILLDRQGHFAAAHNTKYMLWGYYCSDRRRPVIGR